VAEVEEQGRGDDLTQEGRAEHSVDDDNHQRMDDFFSGLFGSKG
jgi:hypothetical protein